MNASVLDTLRMPNAQAVTLIAIRVGHEERARAAACSAWVDSEAGISRFDIRRHLESNPALCWLAGNVIAARIPLVDDLVRVEERAAAILRPERAVAAGLRASNGRRLVQNLCERGEDSNLPASETHS